MTANVSSDLLGNPVSETDAGGLAAVDDFVSGFIGRALAALTTLPARLS